MKSLLLVLLILMPQAVSAHFDMGPRRVFSKRYQRHFWLGLNAHETRKAADRSYLLTDVRVPNDFYMPAKWPLPPGLPFDQAQCGSCVVNSIAGQATYQLAIRGLLPLMSSPLSRGQLMECNPSAGQCDGDYAENVGAWVVSHGKLLSEVSYPYRASNGRCRNLPGDEFGPFVGGKVVDNSPESIGKMMVMGVPPSVTVGAGGAWMDYDPAEYPDGVFTRCSNVGTNHETLLIGIHCRGSAKGADGFCNFPAAKPTDIVYDMLNSWGQWGDKGVLHTVAYSSSGTRCNNIADEVYALDTGVPLPLPPDPVPPPIPPVPPLPPMPDTVPAWAYVLAALGVLGLVAGVLVAVFLRKPAGKRA